MPLSSIVIYYLWRIKYKLETT